MAELVCRAGDPGWLEARRAGVTATDIVTLAGLASWDSPFALYWRKKGRLPEVEQTPRMRLGIWLEESICAEWSGQHPDLAFCEVAIAVQGGLYRSTDRAWQLATPDYLVSGGVLEVKTASSRDGWGDDGTDQVPARVRAQVLWQMDVMGVDRGYVAVCFLPSGEIRSYTITPDPEWIEELRKIAGGFWWGFEADIPPPVDGLPATTEALKSLHGWEPKTTAVIAGSGLGLQWDHWDEQEKEAKAAKAAVANRVRELMGDAQYGTEYDDEPAFRREVYKRREYTVAAGMVDRLVRVKPKGEPDV